MKRGKMHLNKFLFRDNSICILHKLIYRVQYLTKPAAYVLCFQYEQPVHQPTTTVKLSGVNFTLMF